MTTRYLTTNPIELTKIEDTDYCKMIDVVKLIHHEYFETDNEEFRKILDRMEARVCKNAFLNMPKSIEIDGVPPRYAVGHEDAEDVWTFFAGSEDGEPEFEDRICKAARFVNYRDARACADFLDGDWDVLDLEEILTEEERWVRELRMPMPYDADEGNWDAIPVAGVKRK
jgi:hypothetical protein